MINRFDHKEAIIAKCFLPKAYHRRIAVILYSSRVAFPFHTRFYQLWKGGGDLYVLLNVNLVIDKHSSGDTQVTVKACGPLVIF